MKKLVTMLVVAGAFGISGCSSMKASPEGYIKRPEMTQKLLWSYPEQRPGWTVEHTESDGQYYYFVGISNRHTTEKAARDHAMVSAASEATNYFGQLAKSDRERITIGSAAESETSDASVNSRFIDHHVAENLVKRLQGKDWYLEQWKDDTGPKPMWMAFVRARINANEVNAALQAAGIRPPPVDKAKVAQKAASAANVVIIESRTNTAGQSAETNALR